MQISKTLLTCGAAALCLAAISARAVDTEADLRLREALRQKMAEVGPETDTPAKPVKAPKPPKPPKAPKAPKAPAPEVSVEPAPAVAPVVVEPVAAPVIVQPAPEPAPAVSAAATDEERLREAVRARLAAGETPATAAPEQPHVTTGSDLQPVVSSTTIVSPTPAAPAEPAPAVTPAPTGPTTIVAPPSPLAGSKEQRLQALLQQYKADRITPQQYHEERAKILAE